ncbi:MAG: GNAT family N-acetyltransferase [Vicinamibacterales bacterium]
MTAEPAPLRFTLDRWPLEAAERAVFGPDLAGLGYDERLLQVLDGLVSTGTSDDIPHVLRGYRGERLVFAAHPIVCRRTMRTFFPNWLGRLLDVVPMPTVTWTRHDPGVDLCGSPGFVAEGESRDALVAAAIRDLERRVAGVVVLEEVTSPRHGACVSFDMVDTGRHDASEGAVDALFARHGSLRRKVAKFRNKGGTIDVVPGSLPPDLREVVLHCIRCAQSGGLLHTPYQSNYESMVAWATRGLLPGLVHVIARLDGVAVGYHAFAESGRHLICLSGGFDRTRHTTYHAYENVLIEAMRHARDHGLSHVHFGPVSNPSKAAVMSGAAGLSVRFYSRWSAMRRLIAFIQPRSAMRGEALAPYRGLAHAASGDRPA